MRDFLTRTRNADGGWPYYAGRQSRIEPTSWALLALRDQRAARVLAQWRTNRSLLVEPGVAAVNYGFNAVAALALAATSAEVAESGPLASAIVSAIISHKGVKVADHPAIRQDPSLQGWSWTDGTFSWIEPTAWCTLAVKKLAPHHPATGARVDEAERILRDRACHGGGWNFGNAEVYGQQLPAHVPPSALGVLALQDRRGDPLVQDAVRFLRRAAVLEGSTTALALSWIALAAVGQPDAAIAAALGGRATIAREFGNVASAALLLYVLDHLAAGTSPAAFILQGA